MQIHVAKNGQKMGPYSEAQVREMLAAGSIAGTDLGWHEGLADWVPLSSLLAGAAPIPASSGQKVRYRLDRSGDRKLNRVLHMILVTRKRSHPATIAYIERRLQQGKTRREANRCLKRYLARGLYRLLEHAAPAAT